MFVIQCSGVSANQGMFKQQSEWKDSRDFGIVCYIVGACSLLRGVL